MSRDFFVDTLQPIFLAVATFRASLVALSFPRSTLITCLSDMVSQSYI
jgi:hypothetical protein